MRTLLIVVMLVVVAMAAGASFFVRVGAQEPRASLDYVCDPQSVPAGVDTLLRCRVVATNTGTVPLPDVWFGFVPAPDVAIPDAYYFFAARLDGIPLDINSGQINYDLGAIPPGRERVLELDIIVRVTQPSGAVARLYSNASPGREYAQQTLVIEPDGAAPPVEMRLELMPHDTIPGRTRAHLIYRSSVEQIVYATADLMVYDGFSVPPVYLRPDGPPPPPSPDPPRTRDAIALGVTEFAPFMTLGEDHVVLFDVDAPDACAASAVAVVGYLQTTNGRIFRPAVLTDYETPRCANPGDVTALARGGFGPTDAAGWPAGSVAVALLAAGLLALVGGVAAEARGPTRPAPSV